MKRLFISDLDGTLLGPDQRLSPWSRCELERMIADGLPFTVASARSATTMLETLDGLPLRLPMVALNGAAIYDPLTRRRRVIAQIPTPLAAEIYTLARSLGCAALVSCSEEACDLILHEPLDADNGGIAWYLDDRRAADDRRLRELADPFALAPSGVTCLSLIHRRDRLEPIREALLARYGDSLVYHWYENMYDLRWHWLSVHPAAATKAHAIEILARELGFRPDQLVVFGDHDNDIPMFQLAGRAYAVAGAPEALKKHADAVIGPATDSSVVRTIADLWRAASPELTPAGEAAAG